MTFEEWWNTKDYPDCCLLRCKRAFNEGRAELEKENAELVKTAETFQTTAYKLSAHLTKAKEIIAKLLEEEKNNMYWEMNGADKSSYYEVRKQAEQFLEKVKE